MSATYDAAVRDLNDAARERNGPSDSLSTAQVGTGRAVLALTEEAEVVAEQLRRLADVAEAVLLLLQPLADRAAADGVLSSDVVEGAETRPGTRRPARYCPRCPHKLSLHDDDMVCATCSAAEDSDTGPCR